MTTALLASGGAAAHVDYVVDSDSHSETVAEAVRFVVATVSDPLNAALLAAGALGLVGLLVG